MLRSADKNVTKTADTIATDKTATDVTSVIATDSPFSADEQRDLRMLAGLIVGASAEFAVPGADDKIIFADILNSAGDMEAPVRTALVFAAGVDVPLQDATRQLEGQPAMAPLVSLVLSLIHI